ncbi:probable palmitoyltransferase ZDHHC24 [Drosophila santomea]|uniref:probable palmitoyltransferase ZDHHC24 n=1 Tax=Drosophila santomea TaxID=129105 RepID=UPI001954CC57|nr:probable palmitoyltransferase ZDHHC24 [Drosophila santomea]
MKISHEFIHLRGIMESVDQVETISVPRRVVKSRKSWADILAVSLNVCIILFFYFFETFYVMPQFLGWFGQAVHFLLTTWIAYNILGNLWLCTKTLSTVGSLPPEMQQPMEGEEHLWHFCNTCQRTVPPRSWHCNTCNACILKRDHHCNFVGNCVGHNNQRYFIWFSFHAAIGSGVALFDNFLLADKHGIGFFDLITANLIIYNAFMNPGTQDFVIFYRIISVLGVNIFAVLFPAALFCSQVVTVRNNSVMNNYCDRTYDLGIKNNLTLILGSRRLWTFLSPNIKSPLPHNGTQWKSKRAV